MHLGPPEAIGCREGRLRKGEAGTVRCRRELSVHLTQRTGHTEGPPKSSCARVRRRVDNVDGATPEPNLPGGSPVPVAASEACGIMSYMPLMDVADLELCALFSRASGPSLPVTIAW